MIELDRHIEILLLSNDCVIVPDLGGFMAHHIEARYDEEEQLFLPPLRTIGFNPQLKMNDSLLAQSYIEAYDISYPEALSRIEDEVNEVKQHLENEGSYEFNGVGTLSLNEDGNIQFEPCEAGILTPGLYGLSTLDMPMLNHQRAEEKKVIPTPVETVRVKAEVKEEEKKPAATILPFPEYDDDDDERTINIRVSLLRNIAAACIIVIVFFLFSAPLGKGNDSKLMQSKIDTGILTRIMPKDITTGELNIPENKQEKAEAPAPKPAHAEKAVAQKPSGDYYTIVMASHIPLENAQTFVDNLKKDGINGAQVLSRKGSSVKVIYGTYASENEAHQALNNLNGREHFADGWVLKVPGE